MSEEKPPRWRSEVTRSEVTRPEAAPAETFKIDVGSAEPPKVAEANVGEPKTDGKKDDAASPPARKPLPMKKPVPKQAIMIGIAGGAVLGSLLAWGVLSIVWWRRDVNREADFEAEVKAQRQAEIRRKQAEIDDAMRQFSTRKGNP